MASSGPDVVLVDRLHMHTSRRRFPRSSLRENLFPLLSVVMLSCGATPRDAIDAIGGEMETDAPEERQDPAPAAGGGGAGESPGEAPSEEPAGGGSEANTPPITFQRVFDEVIVPEGCTSGYCHGSGGGYLVLTDRETSYRNLVGANVFNGGCGVALRVLPGDPEGSLLWRKIAPDVEVCEGKMPRGTLGISEDRANLVRQWILAGAPE